MSSEEKPQQSSSQDDLMDMTQDEKRAALREGMLDGSHAMRQDGDGGGSGSGNGSGGGGDDDEDYRDPPSNVDMPLWVHRARVVSVISIGLTLLSGFGGLAAAIVTGSSALLAYSLESFVDIFSSALVLWRFSGVESGEHSFLEREKRASVAIAMTFLFIALVVGIQAIVHLASDHTVDDGDLLLGIAITSVIVMTILAAVKFHIAKVLTSPAMRKDGITSAAVAALSLGVVISTSAYRHNPDAWFLDSVVALVVAVLLAIDGSKTLFFHHHRWWNKSFWTMPTPRNEV